MEEQYDMLLYLMKEHELRSRRNVILQAQRLERHRPDGTPEMYDLELAALEMEMRRREEEGDEDF